MRSAFAILLIMSSLSCFSQSGEETFSVKKKKDPAPAQQTMPMERTWANVSFKAVNDSAKLIWWKTQLSGDDTISKTRLRLGYSFSLRDANYHCEITSFAMDFIIDDKIKKLSCNRPYLSQAMAMELSGLKPGSIIIIRDIVYHRWQRTATKGSSVQELNGPGEVKRTGPFRIFVTD